MVTAVRLGSTGVTATLDSLAGSAGVKVVEISSDSGVLRFLYRIRGGDGWREKTNRINDASLSEWVGVTNHRNGRVCYRQLCDNGLDGPIPRPLDWLDQLSVVNYDGNSLSGRISPVLGYPLLLPPS